MSTALVCIGSNAMAQDAGDRVENRADRRIDRRQSQRDTRPTRRNSSS
ncbi:MAG: hypothetical protein VCC36_14040 [Gammaproteobacteria bacterium]